MPLTITDTFADFSLGDSVARYRIDPQTRRVTFELLPASMVASVVAPRVSVDTPVEHTGQSIKWPSVPARRADSLVQVKLRGDGAGHGFALGRTLRNGPTVEALVFERQEVETSSEGAVCIVTHLNGAGMAAVHRLEWSPGDLAVVVSTQLKNTAEEPITVEMLSSFNLNNLTPFARDDAPGRLRAHRFRSCWSSEGRHESELLETLHLERSWAGHSHQSERFGQVGTQPVRGWFPFVGLEDTAVGVLWGARLAWAGSWQMELYRRHDDVNLSGGLADREFGHWWKTLQPGEVLETPEAHLSVVVGDIDDLCHRLTSIQVKPLAALPESENELPILFNEWCSSWGNPTHDYIVETARVLAESEVGIFVIDDGWAERPGNEFQRNGDWRVNRKAFPEGLKATTDALSAAGLQTGLWFEFEVCNPGSRAFDELTDLQLLADGEPLTVGPRRFWNLNDPRAIAYLDEKVIERLRGDGFGYLKVDYNDTIGVGCDGYESPGEGLRQHVLAVYAYFRRIREKIPGILIENCSSGGHRLEPSVMALCAMGSFSDAHETLEIPVIAANLHRHILPRQNQVWAVLNPQDSGQRLTYSLAANFLGRMCLSGDVKDLSAESWALVCEAQKLYRRCVPVIRDGRSRIHRSMRPSYRYPKGWQVVTRESADGGSCLVVAHRFGRLGEAAPMAVPLPSKGAWKVSGQFGEFAGKVSAETLEFGDGADYTAVVLLLAK